MNDTKLEKAMSAAAEQTLENINIETRAAGTPPRSGQLPAVVSVAGIFSESTDARERELDHVRVEIKRLETTIAEEMKFLQELAGKIGLENDQLQALRSHLVKLNMEKAIHMAGITSNYKSL